MARYLMITGLPASGKSSLGRALAGLLGWPHLDKDDFLEARFGAMPGLPTPAARSRLSRLADADFRRVALGQREAVLSSWWRHPASASDSGTDAQWLMRPGLGLLELHCVLPPALALERFRARQRHPGHRDALRDDAGLQQQFEAAGQLGPLLGARAIPVATDRPLTPARLQALADQARRLVDPTAGS